MKPAVGGTARLTIHAARVGEAAATAHLNELLDSEDVVVQPYVDTITSAGEVSVVAIDGTLTHAVVKQAKPGDWRVQSNFGGSVRRVPVDDELTAIAMTAAAALDTPPTYARVDVVRYQGILHVLELELVEPELFFRLAPEAADRLADRLMGDH